MDDVFFHKIAFGKSGRLSLLSWHFKTTSSPYRHKTFAREHVLTTCKLIIRSMQVDFIDDCLQAQTSLLYHGFIIFVNKVCDESPPYWLISNPLPLFHHCSIATEGREMNYIWWWMIPFHNRVLSAQLHNFDALSPHTDGQAGGKRVFRFLVLCSPGVSTRLARCTNSCNSASIQLKFIYISKGMIVVTWGWSLYLESSEKVTQNTLSLPHAELTHLSIMLFSIIFTLFVQVTIINLLCVNSSEKVEDSLRLSNCITDLQFKTLILNVLSQKTWPHAVIQLCKGKIRDSQNNSEKNPKNSGTVLSVSRNDSCMG